MRYYWAILAGGYAAWVSFWLTMGLFAAWRQSIATDFFLEASKKNDVIGMQVGNDSSRYFATWIGDALMLGALWPLPIMAALIVFGFVFKRIARVR